MRQRSTMGSETMERASAVIVTLLLAAMIAALDTSLRAQVDDQSPSQR